MFYALPLPPPAHRFLRVYYSSVLHVPRGTVDYCHWLSLTQVRAANISPPHRYKVHVCRCQSVFAATNLHIATTDNDIHNYSLLLQPQKREAVCFASVKSTLQRQNYSFIFFLLVFLRRNQLCSDKTTSHFFLHRYRYKCFAAVCKTRGGVVVAGNVDFVERNFLLCFAGAEVQLSLQSARF